MNKIVIIIRGGCVQAVYSSDAASVEVVDIDNLNELEVHPDVISETLQEAKEGLRKVY